MLRTENLTKVYTAGDVNTTALSRVNLSIREREFVAVMGPSGCGKSTLLNILGLLVEPTDGVYYFDGRDVGGYSIRGRERLRKSNVSFIFQNFNLIDDITVSENIELPLVYAKVRPKEREKRVDEILERMELLTDRNMFPGQLSGGQQQRVAIARAVVSKPRLLLADEPTGNLDSSHGRQVMELLSALHAGGATIIMVTHAPEYAEYSQRTIHLYDGRIVSERMQ